MIKFFISKNQLSSGSKIPYIPRTVLSGSLSENEVMDLMAYGSTITKADIKAVIENLFRVLVENLSAGRSVNIGFLHFKPQVKGTFTEQDEAYSKDKNRIEIKVSIDGKINEQISRDAKILRVNYSKRNPSLYKFKNLSSLSDESVSLGDLCHLSGENLKFDKNDQRLGVFIVFPESEVRITEYAGVYGNKLQFKFPTDKQIPNRFHFEVRNLFGADIRTGKLDQEISQV